VDQLWATPPGQPIIMLFIPGPGRLVLPISTESCIRLLLIPACTLVSVNKSFLWSYGHKTFIFKHTHKKRTYIYTYTHLTQVAPGVAAPSPAQQPSDPARLLGPTLTYVHQLMDSSAAQLDVGSLEEADATLAILQ
jgi:hypothetical protein